MGYETLLEQIKAVCAWNSLTNIAMPSCNEIGNTQLSFVIKVKTSQIEHGNKVPSVRAQTINSSIFSVHV